MNMVKLSAKLAEEDWEVLGKELGSQLYGCDVLLTNCDVLLTNC